MSNLDAILKLAKDELVKEPGDLDPDRCLRHMHVYFARAIGNWLRGNEFLADAHMKMALLMYETAREIEKPVPLPDTH